MLKAVYHRYLPLRPWLSAVVSGILLALSFPRPDLSILAWVAFMPLLYAIRDKSAAAAGKLAFLSGFVAYAGIFYWLNIVMTTYGKLPWPVSICLTMLMAAYLALYPALAFSLVRSAESLAIPPVIALPVAWVALEYVRAYALSGFPWALLGYTQYRTLPIIQIADLAGVYGVSFLILVVNVFLFQLWRWVRGKDGAGYPFLATLLAVPLLVFTIWYGFVALNRSPAGNPVKIALAQGNIPQDVKWDPAFQEETVAIYERLSRQSGHGTDLIVWPESSLPFYFQKEPVFAGRVRDLARELGVALVVSSPAVDQAAGGDRYYNSAFLIGADGATLGRSDKIHLVPFGEYVPLARLLPFVKKMVYGIGDFSPGSAITPLAAPFGRFGVLICFEGIFPEISREYVRAGAGLLVNITNDAWFGVSSAPYQHLAMTVFRAVENRVSLVRAANTGISAIIDSRGHLRGMTGIFRESLLTGETAGSSEGSFYNRYGDIFAFGCLVAAAGLVAAVLIAARRRTGE